MERKPYTGSCHCGATRFIAFLRLPHVPYLPDGQDKSQILYRCNCSICHKAGIFHVRVDHSPRDFLLLSPLDPFAELGDYTTNEGVIHWFFCKKCGTRCFSFAGEGEVEEVDLSSIGVAEPGEKSKVWHPKIQGWKEGVKNGCYLSINGHAIDQKQPAFDMAKLTDEGAVIYLEDLEGKLPPRMGKPHAYGSY